MINMEVREYSFDTQEKPVARSMSAKYDGKTLRVNECVGQKCKKHNLKNPKAIRNYFLSRQAHAAPLHSRLLTDFSVSLPPIFQDTRHHAAKGKRKSSGARKSSLHRKPSASGGGKHTKRRFGKRSSVTRRKKVQKSKGKM
jgi:hypothetical protein